MSQLQSPIQISSTEKALWVSFTLVLDETTSLNVFTEPISSGKTCYGAEARFPINSFFKHFLIIFEGINLTELQEFVGRFLDVVTFSMSFTPGVSQRFTCSGMVRGKEVKLEVEHITGQPRVNLGLGIFLSANEIPLMGKYIPADFKIGIDGIRTSANGLIISALLGGQSFNFPLNSKKDDKPEDNTIKEKPKEEIKPDVQNKEPNGPAFKLNIIGVKFDAGVVKVKLDASFSIGPLRFDVIGLQMAFKVEFPPKPSFQFDGIGLSFSRPPIEMTGMLYQNATSGATDYVGLAIIKTKAFSILVSGGYAPAEDAVFLFGVLNYSLGGTPAFFVIGLAVGFGFNRKLITPSITEVYNFPLAQLAMGVSKSADPAILIKAIAAWIPPEKGQYWLAVGVKFTSFQLIHGFALLTVSFGNQLKITLLGLASMSMPENKRMVYVELALRAEIDFDAGTVQIEAQVTASSFILDPDCHITGGFAFYLWMKGDKQGDFVLSIGGYHPNFIKPPHYPAVPRVGLNWRKELSGASLSFKGETYFALTPSCVMAGSDLEAEFRMGNICAGFKAGVNFLISWMPFHYEMEAYISIYVSYNFSIGKGWFKISKTFTGSISASLSVWGPPFAGKAHVKIFIISFDICFGEPPQIQPASVLDFRKKFLPLNKFSTISLTGGMLNEWKNKAGDTCWRVDPHQMEIRVESAVPIKQCVNDSGLIKQTDFGVAPVNIEPNSFDTKIEVVLLLNNNEIPVQVEGVYSNVPSALWGRFQSKPSLNPENSTINNVLTGLIIKPLPTFNSQEKNMLVLPEMNYDLTKGEKPIAFLTEETSFKNAVLKEEMALIMDF